MGILVVGLNHKTAPVELRERLAFDAQGLCTAAERFAERMPHTEVVILSTCNRVELYAAAAETTPDAERVAEFLADFHGVSHEEMRKHLYVHCEEACARHLFRVASSLDSMVVGETQVAAQVKEAYMACAERGATGKLLNALFQRAFAVAKRVHTNTAISRGKISVSSVAVELAEQIFERFSDKRVLVVGAGEMSELTARHLMDRGVEQFLIANRNRARAAALAEKLDGKVAEFVCIPEYLAEVDIVISSTSAPSFVIHPEDIRAAMRNRKGRPIFLIDIAVPRDINPEAGRVEDVYLYNIDDLQEVVQRNVDERESEVERALRLIEEEVAEFAASLKTFRIGPTISELHKVLHGIKEEELSRLRNKLPGLSDEQWQQIEHMADRLTNRVAHRPSAELREHADEKWGGGFMDAVKHLFGLD